MNLSDYQLEDTSTLKIRLPDGSQSDIEIDLYHQHTQHYRREQAKLLRAAAEGGDIEGKSVELLASCTKGWRNIAWEGKELVFSRENALKLYSKPGLGWLVDQVDKFIHRPGNFLGKPKSSSST